MLLVPPDNVSIAYLIFWILVFNMATSIIEVPYTAWGAELSRDYDGRTRVTSWRTIAATIGSFIALSIPFALQRAGFEGNQPVLRGMATAYVVTAPIFFLLVLRFVKEPAPRDAQQAVLPLRESIMVIWRSAAFRALALGLMLFVGGKAINSAMNMVFIREVIDAARLFPTMLFLENVAGLAAVPFWFWLGKKLGKAKTMMFAALWSGLWSLPLFLLSEGDGWFFIGLTTMRAISLTAWTILIYSMIADAVTSTRSPPDGSGPASSSGRPTSW
jgi:Na+/melibiose symporter-like transporter